MKELATQTHRCDNSTVLHQYECERLLMSYANHCRQVRLFIFKPLLLRSTWLLDTCHIRARISFNFMDSHGWNEMAHVHERCAIYYASKMLAYMRGWHPSSN